MIEEWNWKQIKILQKNQEQKIKMKGIRVKI
jgi:hypothetical protein